MIFRQYIRGHIGQNKRSYLSSLITIFLAVLILASFLIGVSSYFKSFRDLVGKSTGGYHFRIVNPISSQDANSLVNNRYIKKLGFFSMDHINQGFGSKDETILYKMDENALSTIQSLIYEGSLPGENQIIISNNMEKEINQSIGDFINIGGYDYEISGIYKDMGYDFESNYNIFLNISQDKLLASGIDLAPFIWYKNVFNTYNKSEKLMESLETQDLTYNFNIIYLSNSFVFDPTSDPITDHSFQLISVGLFIILLVLFYSIITNLFLVQESKSLREYGRLKSLGATNKDIGKIISLKTLYVSQLPILLGILSSLGLVRLLFYLIYKVEVHFGGVKSYSITGNLKLNFSLKLFLFIYVISFIIIYLGARKPIIKLSKLSILQSLKGNLETKKKKKYDLVYRGHIEKDLSKQFYRNSKRSFRFANITLKLGFMLMVFIMAIITYYNLDEKYNRLDKYAGYNIHASYPTNKEIDHRLIDDVKSLSSEDFINFRKEFVYLEYDENQIDDEYKNSSSLDRLEDNLVSLQNIQVEIYGINDDHFQALVKKNEMDPNIFKDNKVLVLNTMAKDFNVPKSDLEYIKFLKDDTREINLTEYGKTLKNSGYEFKLNVENKIDKPLFNFPRRENRLLVYMAKSEYIKLFNKFMRIADLDQFEYVLIDGEDIEENFKSMETISLKYFKENDYSLDSKLEEEKSVRKNTMVGNIMALFFSIFFMVVGFSNSYFTIYNLFLERRQDLLLYKAIGMDQGLLSGVFNRERNKIILNFILPMPLILGLISFIVAKSSKIFNILDLIKNLNYIFILAYILIIYISISIIYNKAKKEIIK